MAHLLNDNNFIDELNHLCFLESAFIKSTPKLKLETLHIARECFRFNVLLNMVDMDSNNYESVEVIKVLDQGFMVRVHEWDKEAELVFASYDYVFKSEERIRTLQQWMRSKVGRN